MKRKIKRIDLNKAGGLTVHYQESVVTKKGTPVKSVTSDDCDKPVHQALFDSFNKLIPHLMFRCQLAKCENSTDAYFDEWKYMDDPNMEGVKVTGIVLVEGTIKGVKILGQKRTTEGDVIPIPAPIILLDQDIPNRYTFVVRVDELINNILVETENYLNNKYYDVAQQALKLA